MSTVASLTAQVAALELQLQDSEHAHAQLQRHNEDQRRAAMADRAQLARLGERIQNVEGNREANAALLEDNRFLRAELEAEKLQVQELSQQLELMKGRQACPPTVVFSSSHEQLMEENAKLRNDLQQSQMMLARYTEELSMIMPDVELILTQWKTETGTPALGSLGCGRELPPAPRPVAASSQHAAIEEEMRNRYSPQRSQQQTPNRPQQPRATSPLAKAAGGARPRSVGRGGGGGGGGVRLSSPPRPSTTSSKALFGARQSKVLTR